jgi:hypothetical protein
MTNAPPPSAEPSTPPFCPHCAASITLGARFCEACGGPLPAPPQQQPGWAPRATGPSPGLVALVVLLVLIVGGGAAAAIVAISSNGAAPHGLAGFAGAKTPVSTLLASPPSPAAPSAASTDEPPTVGHGTGLIKPKQPTATRRAHGAVDSSAGLRATSGDSYTIDVPAGWSHTESRVDKGTYVESKWQDPNAPSVFELVDDTRGFTGSAHVGASAVHAGLQHEAGYEELTYAPADMPAGSAWLWVFIVSGDERTDTFIKACNNGYAVLGSAPRASYARFAAIFQRSSASLRAIC